MSTQRNLRSILSLTAALLLVALAGTAIAQDLEALRPQVAGFTVWPDYRATGGDMFFRLSQNRQWVAAMGRPGGEQHFNVWGMSPSGNLTVCLDGPSSPGHGVWDFTWCGNSLVLGDMGRLADFSDTVDALLHGKTMLWQPTSGTVVSTIDEMFMGLLGDRDGTRVVAFSPLSEVDAFRQGGASLRLLQVPGLQSSTRAPLPDGYRVQHSAMIPAPICWHPHEDGWFMLVMRQQGDRPESLWATRFLSFWDVSGSARDVGIVGGRRTPSQDSGRVVDIPGLTPVDDGAAVAAYVEGPDRKDSIVIYGPEGPVRSYYLGAGYDGLGYPLQLARMEDDHIPWKFISMAPDGRRALFQKLTGSDAPEPHLSRRPVWCWDMEADTGYHVATIGQIEEYHGWLSDDAVILGVRNTEADEHRIDYGVLRLPPADE